MRTRAEVRKYKGVDRVTRVPKNWDYYRNFSDPFGRSVIVLIYNGVRTVWWARGY